MLKGEAGSSRIEVFIFTSPRGRSRSYTARTYTREARYRSRNFAGSGGKSKTNRKRAEREREREREKEWELYWNIGRRFAARRDCDEGDSGSGRRIEEKEIGKSPFSKRAVPEREKRNVYRENAFHVSRRAALQGCFVI